MQRQIITTKKELEKEPEKKPKTFLRFFAVLDESNPKPKLVAPTSCEVESILNKDATTFFPIAPNSRPEAQAHKKLLQKIYVDVGLNLLSESINPAILMRCIFNFFTMYITCSFTFQNSSEFKEQLILEMRACTTADIETLHKTFVNACVTALADFEASTNVPLKTFNEFKQIYGIHFDLLQNNISHHRDRINQFAPGSIDEVVNQFPDILEEVTFFLKTNQKEFKLFDINLEELRRLPEQVKSLNATINYYASRLRNTEIVFTDEEKADGLERFARHSQELVSTFSKLNPKPYQHDKHREVVSLLNEIDDTRQIEIMSRQQPSTEFDPECDLEESELIFSFSSHSSSSI